MRSLLSILCNKHYTIDSKRCTEKTINATLFKIWKKKIGWKINYYCYEVLQESVNNLPYNLTHSHSERPKQAWQFWIYFSIKSIFWKIFEGEMLIRCQITTLLQIFCELLLYSQIIFRSMKVADDTSKSNSECEWVKASESKSFMPNPDSNFRKSRNTQFLYLYFGIKKTIKYAVQIF